MIALGAYVKDKLTDFKGTAIARAEYLYGCVWICVVPEKLHEGKPIEDAWFDEERLEAIEKKDKATEPKEKRVAGWIGGPVPNMPVRTTPRPELKI